MATKTIANLNIKLSAGTATLQRDFATAAGKAQQFGSSISSMATKVAGVLAGAFAVNRITSAISNQMTSIDELAKLSDRIGSSIGDVQAIKMAADLAGVGVAELEGGLRKMAVTISDAAGGSATAVAALQSVGLSAQQLRQMDPAAQLAAITQGLQGIGDSSDRVAAASAIFGRGGQSFLNLDSAQIRQAAEDVDRLGLAMTRADAAKVEEANDAITRLSASVGGLVQEVTVALAPAITATAVAITELTAWVGSLDATTVSNTLKLVAFAAAFGGVLMLIPRIVAGIRTIIVTLQAMASAQAITAALSGPAGWVKLAVAAGVAASSVALISTAFDGVTQAADKATGAAIKTAGAIKQAGNAAPKTRVEFVEDFDPNFVEDILPEQQTGNLRATFQGLGKSAAEWQRMAEQTTEEMMKPGEKLERDLQNMQALFDQRLIAPEIFERGNAKIRDDYESALRSQEKISQLQKERGVGAVQAGTSAAFSAIQAGGREMRDMVRGQNAQLAAQKEANKLLEKIATAKPPAVQKAEIN